MGKRKSAGAAPETVSLTPLEMSAAIDVFVAAFCEAKSRTWPYDCERIGNVRVLRDAERKNPKNYRKEEWISFRTPIEDVDRMARQQTRGRYFLCPIVGGDESADPLRITARHLGYRLLAAEPMFLHSLKRIPRRAAPDNIQISLMRTDKQAALFAAATRTRPEPASRYLRESHRQYLASCEDQLVGWVRGMETPFGHWCADLFVRPAWRRQGIASALLARMLTDDRRRGASTAVLLSSHAGAKLYPRLGYRQCGTLLILAPRSGAAVGAC